MKSKVVIAGAGITGLRLAELLGKLGAEPLVVSWDCGGLIEQYTDNGFHFDYGGHVYTPVDPGVRNLMEASGAIKHERNAVYLQKGKTIPYPVQDHVAIDSHDFSLVKSATNLQELGTYAFGKEFYENFFGPFNRRVWTVDPIEMDVDWIKNRVKLPAPQSGTREKWGPNATFLYAQGTSITLNLIKAANEAGASIVHGKIDDVDLERKRLLVSNMQKARYIEYERLYWTLPLKKIAPHVGISSSAFLMNHVLSVGLGFRDILPYNFHWAYFDVSLSPHRVTLLSGYHPKNSPNGKDSLLIEYPYRWPDYPLPRFFAPSLQMKTDYVMNEQVHRGVGVKVLENAELDIKPQMLEVASVGNAPGYPIPTRGIRKIVAETKRRLIPHGIYTAGRWGSWGYFNIDHCFKDAENAVAWAAVAGEDELEEYLYARFYYGS